MPLKNKKVRFRKLTEYQKNRLKEHSKKHSVKHIKAKRYDMVSGLSFNEAHKLAMKKHGK